MFNKNFKNIFKKKEMKQEAHSDSENLNPKSINNPSHDKKKISADKVEFISVIKKESNNPSDLITKFISEDFTLFYIDNLVDSRVLNEHILPIVISNPSSSPSELKLKLQIHEVDMTEKLDLVILELFKGAALIHKNGHPYVLLAKIHTRESRSLTTPENESQVIGSQIGFNENLSTNESLVRRYIQTPDLYIEKLTVGKITNTTVSILFLKSIASDEMVQTLRQRITDLKVDSLIDSAVLAEMIDDNSLSLFPQMLLTERPDRFCDALLNGKLGVFVDGSSMAVVCPYSFVEFFQSREDQNLRWPIASFLRLLRFSAVFLSVYLTPFYVAALTYHYEVIPQSLLVPLSESRALVPFPPIIEALVLELIIELLREAGARLPTKIGQTIGIVGGIVIGTAAVQAGITSNILIIIVALSALASFTTPSYMMGNVIRIIRFPIIILAGFWGFYGITLAFCFLLIHLIKQSSLGTPYTAPFYPPRLVDWRDSIIRLPKALTNLRPTSSRAKKRKKFDVEAIDPEKS